MPLASSVVPDSLTHFAGATVAACRGADGESSAADNPPPSAVFLHAGEPRTRDEGACLLFLVYRALHALLPPPFVFLFGVYSDSLA